AAAARHPAGATADQRALDARPPRDPSHSAEPCDAGATTALVRVGLAAAAARGSDAAAASAACSVVPRGIARAVPALAGAATQVAARARRRAARAGVDRSRDVRVPEHGEDDWPRAREPKRGAAGDRQTGDREDDHRWTPGLLQNDGSRLELTTPVAERKGLRIERRR